MSEREEPASGSASGSDNLILENNNNALVPNPLHGLARLGVLDLSSNGSREPNQVSGRSPLVSNSGNMIGSSFRGSMGGSVSNESRIYKKTNEVAKILPEFNGKGIPINRFIRICRDAERFIDPNDKDFFLRLVKSRVTGEASDYLEFKTFDSLDQLLSELKEVFAPSHSLPQIQTDLARVKQQSQEKVSEYGLRVMQTLQKARELINESFDAIVARGMIEGTTNTAIECFTLGLETDIAARMIGKKIFHPRICYQRHYNLRTTCTPAKRIAWRKGR